jgi:hypothetical protein
VALGEPATCTVTTFFSFFLFYFILFYFIFIFRVRGEMGGEFLLCGDQKKIHCELYRGFFFGEKKTLKLP